MSRLILLIFISFCSVSKLLSEDVDYYWRSYSNGVIPQDALPAGKNDNGQYLYIGQIYEHRRGIFVGTIIPGKTEVEYSAYAVQKADKHIKILCTQHPENFVWLPTTSVTFHEDTYNKRVIIGGHNDELQSYQSIGRVMYDGSVQVGAVTSYNLNPLFYFVYKNKQFLDLGIRNFQVLIYEQKPEKRIDTY